MFKEIDWDKYQIPTTTKNVFSIVEHTLVAQPNFDDLDILTSQIESETIKFIADIKNDLKSEFKDLFLEARDFLLSFEGIKETKKERITTYSNEKGGICHMRTMPYGIDFGFLKGAKMTDEYNVLTGKGKAIRVLPQKGTLNEKVVKQYINQAIEINERRK